MSADGVLLSSMLLLVSLSTSAQAAEGYLLLTPLGGQPTLTDMDGQVVHVWRQAAIAGELAPDGSLIGPAEHRAGFSLGREFDAIVVESWEGEVTWRYGGHEVGDDGVTRARIHHDLERQGANVYYGPCQRDPPDGRVLYLAHRETLAPAISRQVIEDDVVIEVGRDGEPTGFEWVASQHIDQLGLSRLQRWGIRHSPGHHLLMPRWLRRALHVRNEWLHLNAASTLGDNRWFRAGDERFHPDNLILSARHANLVFVIDRVSGEPVWSLGPGRSRSDDGGRGAGRLMGPHHAHLIPLGLPGAGNILVFDNGGLSGYGPLGMPARARPFSRVVEIDPSSGELVWEYRHPFGIPGVKRGPLHRFSSRITGSAQRLPNGNTLIAEGTRGRVLEVDPSGAVVWELVWPDATYRAIRIPPEWVPGNPAGYAPWQAGDTACP